MSKSILSSMPLPYQREVYQMHYNEAHIAEFHHGPLAVGATDGKRARELIALLNQYCSKVEPVIVFNPEMLKGEQLVGGACSAIALRVAREMLDVFKALNKRVDLSEASKQRAFTNFLAKSVGSIHTEATTNGGSSEMHRMTLRTIQQAMNTITIKRDMTGERRCIAEKMRALATYYELSVTKSTQEINVHDNPNFALEIQQLIEGLEPGIYMMRVIQDKRNHKMEEHGHTMVYINLFGSQFYFDPALGLYHIFQESEKGHILTEAIRSAQLRFQVHVLSCHKVERTEAFDPFSEEVISVLRTLEKGLADELHQPFISHAFEVAKRAEKEERVKEATLIRQAALAHIAAVPAHHPGYQFVTPELQGPYAVGVKRYYLEDPRRNHLYLGYGNDSPRFIEIELYYPALQNKDAPYRVLSTLETSKSGATSVIRETQALSRAQVHLQPVEGKDFPILLFSPGLGESLDDCANLTEQVASHGYCVLAISHPHSNSFTRLYGQAQNPLPKLDDLAIEKEGIIKAEDIRFLAECVSRGESNPMQEFLAPISNLHAMGVMGFSLGGSAAIEASRLLPQIRAAVDLDGRILVPSVEKGMQEPHVLMDRPVMLISADQDKQDRTTYEKAFAEFKSKHSHLSRIVLQKAEHGDFTLALSLRKKTPLVFSAQKENVLQQVMEAVIPFFSTCFKDVK